MVFEEVLVSEKYYDIIEEIENLEGENVLVGYAASRRGIRFVNEKDAILDIALRVREAIAADMSEWYQVGFDGSKIKIGDEAVNKFDLADGSRVSGKVKYFGERNKRPVVRYSDFGWDYVKDISKSKEPGAREKIVEELAHDLSSFVGEEFEDMELANKYVDRILALAKEVDDA